MPYYSFKEIWTPLVLFRIRFFRNIETGRIFIKIKDGSRKQLFSKE